ncbi:hypothetical protein [Dongshaea marina]|uniref:hypothetical protein n=1 Tax=Dongshaea marina TaxID=2047966 RepID=UPI00131EFDD0|nr:hypothetical protein [Dongshaea marina]
MDSVTYLNIILCIAVIVMTGTVISFNFVKTELKSIREESALSEQISNYLEYIKVLQFMIKKRWKSISVISEKNLENDSMVFINQFLFDDYHEVKLMKLSTEITYLCGLFRDLFDATKLYTDFHKRRVARGGNNLKDENWLNFSVSLIQAHDKKLKFCYEFCSFIIRSEVDLFEDGNEDLLKFIDFYETLKRNGTLK